MNTSPARIILGLGVIIFGALALLSNLNIANFSGILDQWWPAFIIGAGLVMFFSDRKNYLWSLLVVIVGSILLVRELGLTDFNFFALFWPAVLIILGATLLFGRSRKSQPNEAGENITAILGAQDSKSTSSDYKGGKATAMLGGITLDLRKATIKKEATLDVFAFWDGVEIKVPEGWVIKTKINCILAGAEDSTNNTAAGKNAPTLVLVGDVIMGGVEIKH